VKTVESASEVGYDVRVLIQIIARHRTLDQPEFGQTKYKRPEVLKLRPRCQVTHSRPLAAIAIMAAFSGLVNGLERFFPWRHYQT